LRKEREEIHASRTELRRRGLPVELPGDLQVTVVRKPVMPVLTNPVAAVRRAFQDPVGSTSLDNLARAARSATIAICDITRPVPNHLFLRPLIETLLRPGSRRRTFGCWSRQACTVRTWAPSWTN
jgi:nickel-dependent lactate racemase